MVWIKTGVYYLFVPAVLIVGLTTVKFENIIGPAW
jgi:hypothetical protein